MTIKTLISVSLLFFTVHALEEYFGGFYQIDPTTLAVSVVLHLPPIVIFITLQLLLILLFLLLFFSDSAYRRTLLYVLGTVLLIEISHPLLAIYNPEYYPGLATSFLLLLWAMYYWWQLLFGRIMDARFQ